MRHQLFRSGAEEEFFRFIKPNCICEIISCQGVEETDNFTITAVMQAPALIKKNFDQSQSFLKVIQIDTVLPRLVSKLLRQAKDAESI